MKISKLFLFTAALLLTANLYPQDTSIIKYLPLKVGNIWVYYSSSATISCHGTNWYDKYTLSGTTQSNGKTYFLLNHILVYVTGNCSWSTRLFEGDFPIRVDSFSLNIYKKTTCGIYNEMLIDSLKSRLYDTSWSCSNPHGQANVCTDTSLYNFCGMNRPSKLFIIGGSEYVVIQRYAKDIGLVYYYYYCGGSYVTSLRGCVIDGVVCGDTSVIVGIKIFNSEIPERFHLYQNYPNPFNPVTKIRFDIPNNTTPLNPPFNKGGTDGALAPAGGLVRLIIYNILGQEVTTLVNEPLNPGTPACRSLGAGRYEVEWDATAYPSGVYYYTLTTNEFTDTKKLVLIK